MFTSHSRAVSATTRDRATDGRSFFDFSTMADGTSQSKTATFPLQSVSPASFLRNVNLLMLFTAATATLLTSPFTQGRRKALFSVQQQLVVGFCGHHAKKKALVESRSRLTRKFALVARTIENHRVHATTYLT